MTDVELLRRGAARAANTGDDDLAHAALAGADALALVEAARGAEPMSLTTIPAQNGDPAFENLTRTPNGLNGIGFYHDIEHVAPTNLRRHVAARLIATALRLMEEDR